VLFQERQLVFPVSSMKRFCSCCSSIVQSSKWRSKRSPDETIYFLLLLTLILPINRPSTKSIITALCSVPNCCSLSCRLKAALTKFSSAKPRNRGRLIVHISRIDTNIVPVFTQYGVSVCRDENAGLGCLTKMSSSTQQDAAAYFTAVSD
jgi:hypothetical protein